MDLPIQILIFKVILLSKFFWYLDVSSFVFYTKFYDSESFPDYSNINTKICKI